jgi:S-adenosylmethionine decarboxylase
MIGQHCTWDVYHADRTRLSFVPHIEQMLHAIIDTLKLAKVSAAFKQFEPAGVTGFILLEESHISIHTWPEHNFAAIDVFSCQPFDVEPVNRMLAEMLQSDEIICQTWERGRLPLSLRKAN